MLLSLVLTSAASPARFQNAKPPPGLRADGGFESCRSSVLSRYDACVATLTTRTLTETKKRAAEIMIARNELKEYLTTKIRPAQAYPDVFYARTARPLSLPHRHAADDAKSCPRCSLAVRRGIRCDAAPCSRSDSRDNRRAVPPRSAVDPCAPRIP